MSNKYRLYNIVRIWVRVLLRNGVTKWNCLGPEFGWLTEGMGNGKGLHSGEIIKGSYLVMEGLRLHLIRLRLVLTEGIGSTILKGVR